MPRTRAKTKPRHTTKPENLMASNTKRGTGRKHLSGGGKSRKVSAAIRALRRERGLGPSDDSLNMTRWKLNSFALRERWCSNRKITPPPPMHKWRLMVEKEAGNVRSNDR